MFITHVHRCHCPLGATKIMEVCTDTSYIGPTGYCTRDSGLR